MTAVKVVHMTTVHSAMDGRIFHKECRSLARAGFHVTSIGPHSKDVVVDQVNIKSIPRDRSRLARMTRAVWRTYREALRQNADIYHFHDPELIPVGLLLRARGKSVIYDLHEDCPRDILSKEYLPRWTRQGVAWMMEQLERAACRRFSGLVAVTPFIADRFREINGRTVIVHNFPYAEELIPQDGFGSWDARKQAVAYVGGLTGERGIREMVQAMGLLPASLPASLELAGQTVPRNVQLETLHGEPGWRRVNFHGRLDLPGTFRILQSARAGLMILHPIPSYLDSLPQKFFEYMGAGIPVIVSDFPLWRGIVEPSRCGLLVDPLDTRALAQAIEYVLTHPEEAEEMGRRGRALLLKKYSWHTEAQKLVDLYSVVGKPICAA
jgi:glycosyltransferase involved in cell wall biosynthesis